MDFITISVKCDSNLNDVIIAELFEIGFDSFQEFDDGFEGSCLKTDFSAEAINEVIEKYPDTSLQVKEQEKVNWNEEWEKNYDPIEIANKCLVRATFHEAKPGFKYEIIVNPKMSFGTGHHATTYQVIARQMDLDHQGKKVLDVGCGTGILSIMAAKRGASEIISTDIDDWCIENSEENFALNQVGNVQLIKGEIGTVNEGSFDIVIANINKNVLLNQIGDYASILVDGGTLLLSGFYTNDVTDLEAEGRKNGLIKVMETEREDWAMLEMIKPNP